MAYIGRGPEDRVDVMPTWATDPPFTPIGVYVAMWPVANTPRIDGRWRINSDSLQRPIATRWLLRLQLTHYPLFPLLNNPETTWKWFWFDLNLISGQAFTYSTGDDSEGMSVSGAAEYFDDLGFGLGPGFRWTMDMTTVVDPPALRILYFPDSGPRMQYNQVLPSVTQLPLSVPPQDEPAFGPYYQAVDCDIWPLSECFPTDEWQLEPEAMNALYQYTGPNINLTGGTSWIPWDTQLWSNVGDILDPGDPTKIVVPAGYSRIRLTANVSTSNGANSLTFFCQKNGASFPGRPLVQEKPDFSTTRRLNWSTGILEVVPGDNFQIGAGSSSGAILGSDNSTWFNAELQ